MPQAGSQLVMTLDLAILSPGQHQQLRTSAGPFALARESSAQLWSLREDGHPSTGQVLHVTPRDDQTVHLRWSGWPAGAGDCTPTGEMTCELPLRKPLGGTWIEIVAVDRAFKRRPEQLAKDQAAAAETRSLDRGPSTVTLARWFEALNKLHRWPAGSPEFFSEATRFAVETLGLDGSVVLRSHDPGWTIEASQIPHPELGILCDVAVLAQQIDSPTTQFEASSAMSPEQEQAIVVSPLLSESGQLLGALYGYRAPHAGNSRRGVRYLEAYLFELLANSISHGINRLEKEQAAAVKHAFLEQAFGVTVAQELERNPDCLAGREREVTVLFADLRDFSTLCALLDIRLTYEILNDVMDCLTQAVMDEGGVVLDDYGDGLAAMWNAPVDQPDHPELACRAGLAMLERLPDVAEHWARMLDGTLRLGVGIHTGPAQVGNVGSTHRLKYGARGTSVNLASRVESATKLIGLSLLTTAETAGRLVGTLTANRVCQAKLPGMQSAAELFAISAAEHSSTSATAWQVYHRALALFEQGLLENAQEHLDQLGDGARFVPRQFLENEIRQLQQQRKGRRRGDQGNAKELPVIELQTK